MYMTLTDCMYALAKSAVECCWLELLLTPAGTIPEPLLPKMARYTGRARHMESENEFSLDKALSRCSLPSDSWFHLLHLTSLLWTVSSTAVRAVQWETGRPRSFLVGRIQLESGWH